MAFWNWFQKTADKIDKWSWSPEMKEIIDRIDSMVPAVISKAILTYIEDYYHLGEDKARTALEYLIEKLNEATKPIK